MSIQWYPGHMHKAGKEMDAVLPNVDVVVEVLDARLPYSSANPMLEKRLGSKPRLRVLTRADLADPVQTERWLEALSGAPEPFGDTADGSGVGSDAGNADEAGRADEGRDGAGASPARIESAIAISLETEGTVRQIPERLRALAAASDAAAGRDGFRAAPRTAMIVGIPNVGKSTLINRLAGRTIARTGNEPAVTRRQQSVPLGEGWRLRDTPGVLWPNVENVASGFRLAASGAVRDTAMDSGEVAVWLIEQLVLLYPDRLAERYGEALAVPGRRTAGSGGTGAGGEERVERERPATAAGSAERPDGVVLLERIGRARGCFGAGRLVDFDRAGRLLLQEFRSGRLGRITLETPTMRTSELLETAERRAALEAKREERREARRRRRRKRA